MKERERVLELVKKGIISTEEALVLLESMATEKDEKLVKKEEKEVTKEPVAVNKVDLFDKEEIKTVSENPDRKSLYDNEEIQKELEEAEKTAFEKFEHNEEEDRQRLEKILDDLATEVNRTSAELDEINAEIKGLTIELKEKHEAMMILNTKEELETLSESEESERHDLAEEIAELNESLSELEVDREELEAELKDIRKEQRENNRESWSAKFELPDDWKENASETFNQMGEKMGEAGSQLGQFLKKTFNTVADTIGENVDWKDVNIKVPGVSSTKFDHEFLYPESLATLVDVKVANGKVLFKVWDEQDVKVTASIKLYGKMDADTPLEAFLERSQIEVNDETISFQIPNKRIRADLVFYLPKRIYDHVSVKLLNGDVEFEDFEAKDVYVKSTNGTMDFDKLTATMLEVEGVNGDVTVVGGQIMDFLGESVNGNFTVKSSIQNTNISLINGDVKVTTQPENLKKIEASVVNGSVKVSLPQTAAIEGLAKTSLGSIKNRMSDFEIVREKKERTNQLLQFRRIAESDPIHIKLSTTTGSIYLKDSDQ